MVKLNHFALCGFWNGIVNIAVHTSWCGNVCYNHVVDRAISCVCVCVCVCVCSIPTVCVCVCVWDVLLCVAGILDCVD